MKLQNIQEPKALNNIYMMLLACCVGFMGSFGAILFRSLIGFIHNLFFYGNISFFYNANIHTPQTAIAVAIILIPITGSFLVTFFTEKFAPEAKGHGVPEAIYAIYYKHGKK